MKAIQIDEFIETLEERRMPAKGKLGPPAAGDWGRLVEEGRAARVAADGGRWRIGQLASLVERRYASAAVQRFAEEIGESYSTVRRYRWVFSRYDTDVRFRFPSLAFSHFQAVAGRHDRLPWLDRAQRNGWSVDELTRRSHASADERDGRTSAEQARTTIDGLRRSIAQLSEILEGTIPASSRSWLKRTLADIAGEIVRLQERLGEPAARPPVHRAARSRPRAAS